MLTLLTNGFFFGIFHLEPQHDVWWRRFLIPKGFKGCAKRSKKNFELSERFEKIIVLRKFLWSHFCEIVNKCFFFWCIFSHRVNPAEFTNVAKFSLDSKKSFFSKLWKTTRECFWWTMTTLIHSFKSCKVKIHNIFVFSKFLWLYYKKPHLLTMSTWL